MAGRLPGPLSAGDRRRGRSAIGRVPTMTPPPADGLPDDWAELIGYSVELRRRLAVVDPELSPVTVPRLAAGEAELDAAEQRLGRRLDDQHRALLRHGDGWPWIFTYTDLLGADELGAGPRWDEGQHLLDLYFAEAPVGENFPARADLLPIAVGADVTDVFALWATGPRTRHGRPVLWLAGDEIDRWPTTREWLLAINQYLANDLARRTR